LGEKEKTCVEIGGKENGYFCDQIPRGEEKGKRGKGELRLPEEKHKFTFLGEGPLERERTREAFHTYTVRERTKSFFV